MHTLLRLIASRGLWSFIGLLALAALIWIAGPLLAVGSTRPLESESARIWMITIIFSIWLLRLLVRHWRAGRLNAQLLSQLRRPAAAKAENPPADPELAELERRFDEAVDLLRKTRFDSRNSRMPWARFSRQYLYQLPWYVFIGAPGSGKTTALVNSGLQFPLADRFGKTALRGVGGTQNCDWWFTDEAVLLDTAGRYTTHESDAAGDEREWRGFLGLLTRFRGRQPINGAMLTVSVADLLSASDSERVAHAAVLRRRLQELREQLGIRFPVYVLVTKADLLAGFEAYFAGFSRDDLAQVWGFTLPYAQSESPDFDLYDAFNTEYGLLQRRLDDALPDLLAAEPDEHRRAAAYLLPQQFAGLQRVLGQFLSDVFATTKFDARLVPRGVYFTSGTQGGEPFDQVTGRLRRYLRIDAPQPVPSTDATGRSYFLKRLLQDVIFKESGLAGRNLRWERRHRRLHWAGYAVMATVLIGLLGAWAVSYQRNQAYVDTVAARVPTAQERGRNLKVDASGDVLGVMPYLDVLWYLPQPAAFELDSPPLSYRWGLYQGDKLRSAAHTAYDGTLDDILRPMAARRVEAALRSADPKDLEYSYEALRAYLMMYDTQRYEPDFMHAWLLADMQRLLPGGYTRQQYERLSQHLRRLVQDRVLASPFPRDDALVEKRRLELARHPLADRTYSRLRRLLSRDERLAEVSIDKMTAPQGASVFTRASGLPLSKGVSGLFTYRGYWDVFNPRIGSVADSLRRDDGWVLNLPSQTLELRARGQLVAEVKRRYFNDYIREWDAYLADIRMVPATSLLHSIQAARTLSAPDSPLIKLVQGVARETTLLRDAGNPDATLMEQARARVSTTRDTLEQMFGPVGPEAGGASAATGEDQPERVVDRHFEAWHRLAQSRDGAPPPIQATTALIDQLYGYLTAADAALRSGSTAPDARIATQLRAEAGRTPAALGGLLDNLSLDAMSQVSGVARARMGENVSATIGLFCRQSIAGRYPFAPDARRDAAPNDVARLFAPNGMMDEFLHKQLASQIDVSGQRWRFKPGIDGRPAGDSAYLDAFQRATVIRDVYFAGAQPTPSFRVSIRPVEMDAQINQFVMDVDGQSVRYAHGPQVATAVQWPGPRGAGQVRIELQPQGVGAGLATQGPWALNRMLDQAELRAGPTPEVLYAHFDFDGREVVLEITASSVKNPFLLPEMHAFACPGQS